MSLQPKFSIGETVWANIHMTEYKKMIVEAIIPEYHTSFWKNETKVVSYRYLLSNIRTDDLLPTTSIKYYEFDIEKYNNNKNQPCQS